MKKHLITFFTTLSLAAASHAAEPLLKDNPDNTAPEGFTLLFNGKSLDNWKGLLAGPHDKPHTRAELKKDAEAYAAKQKEADDIMRKHWTVTKDGELFFDGKKGGWSLATAKDYGDFEMYVSWKLKSAHGDSGIYLRGLPQVQIWDTKSEKCIKHGADKGSGGLWNNRNAGRWPLVHADNPVGEWNHFFIRMVGDDVSVWLNGKLVVDKSPLINLWQQDKPLPKTEQIELQCHGDPVYFKNIYIREL